jgi:hypothetical protein
LELRDYRVSRGWPVDKVTEKFVGTHPGSWRELWTLHARGDGLNQYLDATIEEYCCVCLNDSFNESPHAEMGTNVKKKQRAKPGLWFALHRFQEAMDFKRKLDKTNPGRFGHFFRGWKHVFTRNLKRRSPMFPRRLPGFAGKIDDRTVICKAYRLNEFAILDSQGTGLDDSQRQFLSLHSAQAPHRNAISYELQVKKEYLKSVLKEGTVFSVATGEGGDVAIGDSPAGDPDCVDVALLPTQVALFEVVDCKAAQKSYVVDIADVDEPMRLPMMIRQLSVHKSSMPSSSWETFSDARQEHFVFSVEPPKMTDVMVLAPIRYCQNTLVKWSCRRASAVMGCMQIFSPFNCALIQWHWELWKPIIVIDLEFKYSIING